MGITVNGSKNISVALKDTAERLRTVHKSLYNAGVVLAREIAYEVAVACAENTPVQTGNLLMNWHIAINGAENEYDDEYKNVPRGTRADQAARRAAYLPAVEAVLHQEANSIESKVGAQNINHATIYNKTPYAAQIEDKYRLLEYGEEAAQVVIDRWKTRKGFGALAEMEYLNSSRAFRRAK